MPLHVVAYPEKKTVGLQISSFVTVYYMNFAIFLLLFYYFLLVLFPPFALILATPPVLIKEVALHRARLLLGWVTVCWQVNHLTM